MQFFVQLRLSERIPLVMSLACSLSFPGNSGLLFGAAQQHRGKLIETTSLEQIKIPKPETLDVNETLSKPTALSTNTPALQIIDISDVPKEMSAYLVKINQD